MTAITTLENLLSSGFDQRFGRAEFFCLYNEERQTVDFLPNSYATAAQANCGAMVAKELIRRGVTKIISGDFGPNAKILLDEHNIQLVILPNNHLSLENIIDLLANRAKTKEQRTWS